MWCQRWKKSAPTRYAPLRSVVLAPGTSRRSTAVAITPNPDFPAQSRFSRATKKFVSGPAAACVCTPLVSSQVPYSTGVSASRTPTDQPPVRPVSLPAAASVV